LPANNGTETARAITAVAINPDSTKATLAAADSDAYLAGLKFAHYVAKAYPVLNRESMDRNVDSPSLELGITKVEKDGMSAVVEIKKIN
jgi:hypothetical protein